MNLNNYTIKSQEALQQAQLITQISGNQFIENEHILKAIFEIDKNVIPFILNKLNIKWLITSYNLSPNKESFFNNFFTKLAGTKKLQEQITKGINDEEIRKSWLKGLYKYDEMRKPYLLY